MGSQENSDENKIRKLLHSGQYLEAYDLLADLYIDAVFSFCLRMLNGDDDQAREMSQEVFGIVGESIQDFRGESQAKTWLFGIAKKCCMRNHNTIMRRRNISRNSANDIASSSHIDSLPSPESAFKIDEEYKNS